MFNFTPNQLKWLEALESDEYTQGTGRLCTTNNSGSRKYCCLGVACDLAAKDGVASVRQLSTNQINYDNEGAIMPPSVSKWLGTKGNDNNLIFGSYCVTEMNDRGKSFAEIAAWVRNNAEHVLIPNA